MLKIINKSSRNNQHIHTCSISLRLLFSSECVILLLFIFTLDTNHSPELSDLFYFTFFVAVLICSLSGSLPARATASLPSSLGGSQKKVTSKLWFVTFHEEILIWKQNQHLKLQGCTSAGCVVNMSVMDEKENTVQVSIKLLLCLHVSLFYYYIHLHRMQIISVTVGAKKFT